MHFIQSVAMIIYNYPKIKTNRHNEAWHVIDMVLKHKAVLTKQGLTLRDTTLYFLLKVELQHIALTADDGQQHAHAVWPY